MLHEGGAAPAQVHGHIQHASPDYTYQLGLAERPLLVMKAPEHASGTLGLIVLDELCAAYMGTEILLSEGFHKIASFIPENPGPEDKDILYLRLYIFHISFYMLDAGAKIGKKTELCNSWKIY